MVETVIEVVYKDNKQSLEIVWETFKDVMEPFISPKTLGKHLAIKLHETSKNKGLTIKFKDSWDEGWTMKVFINGQFIGKGECDHKKEVAHNRAAKNALKKLKET